MNEKETDLRAMALDSLIEYGRTQKKLDEIVHETLQKNKDLDPSRKAFYVRLTQGCVEQKIRLDHIIGSYSNTPVKKIRPVLLWILRMAAYQIYENDSTPDRVAVNEAVRLAGERGFGNLKGYVNAVLRNMIRYPGKVVWPAKEEPVRYLSVRYSMPEYLARKFIEERGLYIAEEISRSFLDEKPITVHCKMTGTNEDETIKMLENDGFSVEKASVLDHAYYISGSRLETSKAFQEGRIWVQDISSQLAVHAAGIKAGDRVLDVCAAPGGKSLLAADLLLGSGTVRSRDVTKAKILKIEENRQRTGLSCIQTEVFDATKEDPSSFEQYDVVLADVPCSGYGVIGKKPDIKYTASSEKEKELAAIGQKILDQAAKHVKKGGTLLFSTCTINRLENEENVRWFVKNHPYRLESLEKLLPGADKSEELKKGYLQLLPNDRQDGFFLARFVHE